MNCQKNVPNSDRSQSATIIIIIIDQITQNKNKNTEDTGNNKMANLANRANIKPNDRVSLVYLGNWFLFVYYTAVV